MDPGETRWLARMRKERGGTPRLLEQDSFDDLPFNQMGDLGRAYESFGEGV